MNAENPVENGSENFARQGTSGRKITWVVIGALLVTVLGISYVLGTYNQIDRVRVTVEDKWRTLSEQLSTRYRDAELLAAKGVDAETVPMEIGEKFRLAVDRFRTTAQRSIQLEAAREIESLLPQVAAAAETPSEELNAALQGFNAEQVELAKLVDSPAGKLLGSVLILDDTAAFELSQ